MNSFQTIVNDLSLPVFILMSNARIDKNSGDIVSGEVVYSTTDFNEIYKFIPRPAYPASLIQRHYLEQKLNISNQNDFNARSDIRFNLDYYNNSPDLLLFGKQYSLFFVCPNNLEIIHQFIADHFNVLSINNTRKVTCKEILLFWNHAISNLFIYPAEKQSENIKLWVKVIDVITEVLKKLTYPPSKAEWEYINEVLMSC